MITCVFCYFILSKQLADIDECANFGYALCPASNSQCLNMEGSFSCVCQNGFYWSNTASVCVGLLLYWYNKWFICNKINFIDV